ncbi:RadC family protein [Dissulfuribacter thermophilus]|nr:DNA repair protein RadC [Dissulfuribacter thermophilus]
MNKKDWLKRVEGHRDRLRERFLRHGIASFTDSDIIELLLTFGTPRQDCKERARALLKRFGSLSGVLEASIEELQEVKGVGPKNAMALKFVHEVARRFLRQRILERSYVQCARDVVEYLWHSLSFKDREFFIGLYLDTSNRIIEVLELFSGTLDRTAVYPREVVKTALDKKAKSIILVHNHPSGRIEPSTSDLQTTKKVMLGAMALDIRVLDHIIIGGPGDYFSFEENGIMERLRLEVVTLFHEKR